MTLVAVGMVKDEADVIGGVLRHLASEGVERIVVLDNGSTDGTTDLISETSRDLGCDLAWVWDPEPGYYQSLKITRACEEYAQPGDWVIPFDADEIWHAGAEPLGTFFREVNDFSVVHARVKVHYATDDDAEDETPFAKFVWRHPEIASLPKCAVRWQHGTIVEQGAHGIRLARPGQTCEGALTVRHYPYRTPEQFVQKVRNGIAALEAAPELPDAFCSHWREYARVLEADGEDGLRAIWDEHFWYPDPAARDMVLDPAPYMRWA